MDMDCRKRRSTVASDLPEDSLVEILARVPARSLCRSKCVAKAWRDLIEDPFHGKKLPQTLQGFFTITSEWDTCTRLHIGYVSPLTRSARRQIDPSFSFLTKLPGFESLAFCDSCNGLLVFERTRESLGYVVCNPTTKQWGAVPRYEPSPSSPCESSSMYTGSVYLVFDPAVSSHFHLVQFEQEEGAVLHDDDDDGEDVEELDLFIAPVNVYSSESGQWIHIESGWDKHNLEGCCLVDTLCAVLNGMLHFKICANHKDQIAVVDVQGVTRKVIPVPITYGRKQWPETGYVVQSQGRLHYINKTASGQLSIWVLEDYDTKKWVFKHSVSFRELFGTLSRRQKCSANKQLRDYNVVAMHPDGNMLFIIRAWNKNLVSYDMDHKLVSIIETLEDDTMHVVPYVPYFLESPSLTNKL